MHYVILHVTMSLQHLLQNKLNRIFFMRWIYIYVCGFAYVNKLGNGKSVNGHVLCRYSYCEKCFTEIVGDEVELVDDPSQPVV